jgi:four helix bundle protein
MKNFRKLNIWQKGIDLVIDIYKFSNDLPSDEKYGLISQIRRASVSIPSNIAEGSSRNSEKDFKRFLEIAIGSAFELETQLLIIQKLNLIEKSKCDVLIQSLQSEQKMINSLIIKIKRAKSQQNS